MNNLQMVHSQGQESEKVDTEVKVEVLWSSIYYNKGLIPPYFRLSR